MKTIEELKKEQYNAKAKLHELMELINSEEFYTLTASEKNLIGQQRVGIEVYLNALTKSIYDKNGCSFDMSSAMWPLLMSNVFSNSLSSTSSTDYLKNKLDEKDFEIKEDTDEA